MMLDVTFSICISFAILVSSSFLRTLIALRIEHPSEFLFDDEDSRNFLQITLNIKDCFITMHSFHLFATIFAVIFQAFAADEPISEQDDILISSTNQEKQIVTPDDFSTFNSPDNVVDDSQIATPPTLEAQNSEFYLDPNLMFKELCGDYFKAACCIGNQLPIHHDQHGNPTGQSIHEALDVDRHPDISDLCTWYDFGDPYCEDFDVGHDQKLLAIICCGSIKIRPDNVAVGQERSLWPYEERRRRAMSSWPNIPWTTKRTPGIGLDCLPARKDTIEDFRNQMKNKDPRLEGNLLRCHRKIDIIRLTRLNC